jgi:hypothetical protein
MKSDRNLLWIILILLLLVGGAIRRALRTPDEATKTELVVPQNPGPDPEERPPPASDANLANGAVDVAAPNRPAAQAPPANPGTVTAPTPPAGRPVAEAPQPENPPASVEQPATSTPTAPTPAPRPTLGGQVNIEHTASGEAPLGGTLAIQARISNLRPLDIQQYQLTAYFRASQTAKYRSLPMTRIRSTWTGGIPIGPDMEAGLEYFIKAKPTDSQDGRLTVIMSGNNRDPHRVRITNP